MFQTPNTTIPSPMPPGGTLDIKAESPVKAEKKVVVPQIDVLSMQGTPNVRIFKSVNFILLWL